MIYKTRLNEFLIFIIILIQLNGCGIYSFLGASIANDINTISIQYIKNNAPIVQPNLSNNITESLKTKCLNETNLSWREKDADINFYGTIISYKVEPISIQNNETAAQNRLTIKVEIIFVNNKDDSQNFNKTFTHYTDFNSNENFLDKEDELNELIISNLIDDIFNAALTNW